MPDALVLGAGAAGLACAAALARAGATAVVLEARDRIGGRIWTDRTFAPHPVEFGAEFVHGERASVWPRLRAEGLATSHWPKADESLVHAEPGGPRDGWVGMATLRALDPRFDATRAIDLATAPPPSPFESLDAYLERVGFDARQRRYVRRSFANATGESPERIDARSALANLADERDGREDHRVDGGYDRLAEALARGLDVRLGAEVVDVRRDADAVSVTLADGARLIGRSAVVTLPVGVLRSGAVTFDDRVWRAKRDALVGLAMGPVLKLVTRLRRAPVDGDVWALYAAGEVPMWWSPSAGRDDPQERAANVWTGFVSGAAAADLRRRAPAEALRRAVGGLGAELGSPLEPADARLIDWPGDPYARGGYSVVLPGHAGAREVLAEPTPPLFWAGEATAREGAAATVHGAVESGERAAREVLALLA